MATTVTATESMAYSQLNQVVDVATTPTRKWFSLQENKLDGSFYPMDSSGASQIGWWGTQLSGPGGIFSSPPVLTITLDPTTINALSLSGDSLRNEFPVDFTYKLYNASNALLFSLDVVGNNAVNWEQYFEPYTGVTKIVLTVSKINKASRTVKVLDAKNVTSGIRNMHRVDILAIAVSEGGTLPYKEFSSTDTLATSIAETVEVTNTFTSQDSLTLKVSEVKHITAELTSDDELLVSRNLEADFITAELFSGDSLNVTLKDESRPTNIYTVMDASVRQTFIKVEITYTSPFDDETINYSASETGRYTSPDNLADNVEVSAYKWFSLHENKLDGSFHPMPASGLYSTGWWGTQLSNDEGVFASPPVVTVTFSARAITFLKVVGDSVLNNYPVDFVVKLYDPDGEVLLTRTVENNDMVRWVEPLDPFVANVAKMELTINKINRPRQVAKVMEFFTAIVETYYSEDVQRVHLLEEIGYKTGSLPMGNVSANEIDVTIVNTNRRFDLGNVQSKLYGNVKRNRRVRAWLGAYVGDEIEWSPLGVFWTTQWDIPKDSMFVTLTARDRLELLRNTDFRGTSVLINKDLYWLFEMILQDAGLTEAEYDLDPALADVVIPYVWFGRVKHRQALAQLAGVGIVQVYCTKEGLIRVNLHLDATPTVMAKFDDDVNVINAKFPLAVKDEVNHIEVTAQQLKVSTSQVLFESNNIITVPANSTITYAFQFENVPVVGVSEASITADAGVSIEGYVVYSWGAEISFSNTTGAPANITAIKVTGTKLDAATARVFTAKDDALIRQDGEIKQTVSHEFIQDFTYAQNLADTILQTFKTSRNDVTLINRGNPAIRLNDKATYEAGEYTVVRQTIDWDGTLSATTEGKKL